RPPDGRCRARSEPELRTAQRLQPAARLPPRLRGEGRSDRVRPPGDQDAADRISRALRDPAPVPDPAPAAAGQALPPRGLRARPPPLPVLRAPVARPDPRPRRPAPPWRRAHLGEPRRRVQAVQPPQGGQDARGGPAASASPGVRAAQRHLLPVHAIPRRRAQRSVALLPVPGSQLTGPAAAIEAAIPAAVDDLLQTLSEAGHAAYVV